MFVEIGNDIVKVERIKKSIEQFGEKFKEKVFTAPEIEYCEKKGASKYQSYAARFAAKEAVYKAMCGNKNLDKVNWIDIEVLNSESGKPEIVLHNEMLTHKEDNRIHSIAISISHETEYAIASVVLLKGDK